MFLEHLLVKRLPWQNYSVAYRWSLWKSQVLSFIFITKYNDFTKDSQNKTMAGSGFAVKIIEELFLETPKVCNL